MKTTRTILTVLCCAIVSFCLNAQPQHAWSFGVGAPTPTSGIEQDVGFDIKPDAAGNVFVCGRYGGIADFDPGPGTATLTGWSGFIAKYDPYGIHLWSANLGGEARALDIDGSGNVYVVGTFAGTFDFDPGAGTVSKTSAGGVDIYVAKFSPSGALVWVITMGGNSADYVLDITLDNSGNFLITGYFKGAADFDPSSGVQTLTPGAGLGDVYFAKYNSSGAYIFAKQIGCDNFLSNQDAINGHAIVTDSGRNIYLLGVFQGTTDLDPGSGTSTFISYNGTSRDIFLARYDSSGSYIWSFGIGDNPVEMATAIDVDNGDNVYIGGRFGGSTSNQINLDPAGSPSGVITAAGSSGGFVAKYSPSKVLLWGFGIGATVEGLSVSGSEFCITGSFSSGADFDGSTMASHTLTTFGSTDIYFGIYSASTSAFQSAYNLGGPDADWGESVSLTGSNIYLTGYFKGTADFDPDSTTAANSTSAGGSDIHVVKLGPSCVVMANSSSNIICAGSAVTLSTNSTSNILWSTGSNSTSIVVTPTTSTSYTVSGTLNTGTNSCTSTLVIYVTVVPLITASSSTNSICAGSAVTLSTNATTNVLWNTGSNSPSISVTPTANTTYTVSGTAGSGTNACTSTVVISVSVNPQPNILIVANKNSACKGQSITLTASNAAQYSWTGGSTNNSIVVTAATPTTLTYSVTGTNEFGCSKQAAITVTFTQCAGIPEPDKLEVLVCPNPSGGKFTVTLDQQIRSGSVQVFNGEGKLVLEKTVPADQFELDLSAQPVGVYLLRLKNDSGVSNYQKLIKTE